MNQPLQSKTRSFRLWIVALILSSPLLTGCSSLGLSTWPAQFPLLKKTRELTKHSPVPHPLPNEITKSALQEYFVEPGDRILIEPIALDSEIGSFGDQKIQIDGSVDLGKFGRVRVAGMSVEQIELLVEEHIAMRRSSREQINVQLVESNAAEIYVLGEVGSPAAYPVEGHEHVLDAILRAGGLTSKASPCDIVLVRPTSGAQCRVVLPVCYRQITQLGDSSSNYQLQPGDRIVVGSRTFWEEIAFWKQQKSCQCCDQSACAESNPSNARYQNRFLSTGYGVMPGFVTAAVSDPPSSAAVESLPDRPPLESDAAGKSTVGNTKNEAKLKSEKAGSQSDESLFLPPLNK